MLFTRRYLLKIIKPYHEIINPLSEDEILKHLELAARLCYKSEHLIKPGSAETLLKRCKGVGHMSVFEHIHISVRIICDRGISHELVRHRLCNFSQESTRYVNYSKGKFNGEMTVIKPFFWDEDSIQYEIWKGHCEETEFAYTALTQDFNATAQEARSVLPNSLKTEIITTANIREWLHIFSLRSSWKNKKAHPQMIEIMDQIREDFITRWPTLFGDE